MTKHQSINETPDHELSFADFEALSDEELDAYLSKHEDSVSLQVDSNFKSGFVALIGRPNAGKSTLLNACMGQRIAITSPVAQTTRRRMRAVINRPNTQIVIVDTPGLHKPKDGLGTELNRVALAEIQDVDVIAFVVDASAPFGRGDEWVAKHLAHTHAYKLLVLTKADKVGSTEIEAQISAARSVIAFDEVLVVSAHVGFNVESFVQLVTEHLPSGPKWFPEDMDTDEPDEMLVAEFIREKVLLRTSEEIPHSVGVLCNTLEAGKHGLLRINATIFVEREGQKGILIGKKGAMIKRLGSEAREDLERLFNRRVFLELSVKVKPHWRDSARDIRLFGYSLEDE
ncbi:GTPase Era [Collinsella sp. zg1085]|uniref:GTPase Era n=1 Tax=Collinsella sp. zg1085 TaxID=2844380 RepID=UPI001C0D7CDE|nr:GTPase Era [Collinsella sp. zg1085]QWT16984.1 GTPase Era [Collinsella sp. zg1085]